MKPLAIVPVLRARPDLVRPALAWSLVVALPSFLSGRLIASAVDDVLAGDLTRAFGWLGAFAVVSLFGMRALERSVWWNALLVEEVRTALAIQVVRGVLLRSFEPGFEQRGGVEVSRHLESVRNTVVQVLGSLGELFGVALAILGIATVVPILLPGLFAALGLGVVVLVVLYRCAVETITRASIATEQVAGAAAEAIAGTRDIVAARAVDRTVAAAQPLFEEARLAAVAQSRQINSWSVVTHVLGRLLPVAGIIGLTPWLLRNSYASAGGVVGAIAYTTSVLGRGFGLVSTTVTQAATLRVIRDRLLAMMSIADGDGSNPERSGPSLVVTAAPTLRAADLMFAFSARSEPIVDGSDLVLEPGEHLAVVGASGIGKSTLANLLTGVLTPTRGDVLLDDRSLSSLPSAAVHAAIGLVPQEAYIFTGTLRENLAYMAPDATDAELLAAGEAVGLDRVLQRLGGLDAPIGSGQAGLSEGEKQLIVLARVHASAAPIVILDEATCYLDPVAEEQAESAFKQRRGSLIVIAHRMSSTLRADRVLVMEPRGWTLGTHDELLAVNPLYAELHGLWVRADI